MNKFPCELADAYASDEKMFANYSEKRVKFILSFIAHKYYTSYWKILIHLYLRISVCYALLLPEMHIKKIAWRAAIISSFVKSIIVHTNSECI